MVWVSMTDKVMSGWGPCEGRINKLLITCENYDQALQIVRAAKERSEMDNIETHFKQPRFNPSKYYVSEKVFAKLGEIWTGEVER